MPLLSRSSRPLLRKVNGQQHARDADFVAQEDVSDFSELSEHDSIEAEDADLTRDPDSSEDEAADIVEEDPVTDIKTDRKTKGGGETSRKKTGNESGVSKLKTGANGHERARTTRSTRLSQKEQMSDRHTERPMTGAKRKSAEVDEDDIVQGWTSSFSQSKRTKTANKYGSRGKLQSTSVIAPPKSLPSTSQELKAKPVFKRPTIFSSPGSQSPGPLKSSGDSRFESYLRAPLSKTPKVEMSPTMLSSPPLSPLSSAGEPEIEEVYIGMPNPADQQPCPICETPVSKSFYLDWELEHCRGRRMNLKMQEKFCRAHQEDSANERWQEQKYPTVDWNSLRKRLATRKHKERIEAVLAGDLDSDFKRRLEGIVTTKDSRTVTSAFKSELRSSGTGYYGHKGAAMMAEFALKNYESELKALARRDGLLATRGVAGGVSGFVQAVIVPEMALSLIMEDLQTDETHARKVLEQSGDLGAVLHTADEDKVDATVRPATPPRVYGADDADSFDLTRLVQPSGA